MHLCIYWRVGDRLWEICIYVEIYINININVLDDNYLTINLSID